MKIEVSDETGQHLRELAAERNLTIEELIRAMLDRYDVKRKGLTLADLAEIALSAGLSSDKPVDTAARSREILQTEYAEYLHRRRSRDAHS